MCISEGILWQNLEPNPITGFVRCYILHLAMLTTISKLQINNLFLNIWVSSFFFFVVVVFVCLFLFERCSLWPQAHNGMWTVKTHKAVDFCARVLSYPYFLSLHHRNMTPILVLVHLGRKKGVCKWKNRDVQKTCTFCRLLKISSNSTGMQDIYKKCWELICTGKNLLFKFMTHFFLLRF